MPGFWLKRQILMNLPSEDLEVSVANSIDFMVERVSATFSPHLVLATLATVWIFLNILSSTARHSREISASLKINAKLH